MKNPPLDCFLYEKKAKGRGANRIAGVDEAGRGPLAGPVVAAACVLPSGFFLEGLRDSKQLSEKDRAYFYKKIVEMPAIDYGIGVVEAERIDEINILQATMQAMILAVMALALKPNYILVDGNRLPSFGIKAEAIVKGDSLSTSIMAAAVIAKYTRDQLMEGYHKKYPLYGFGQHKGYGTLQHRQALKIHGPCPIHRKTFSPVASLL